MDNQERQERAGEKSKDDIPISRKTIFRLIDDLKEDGIVEETMEKPNSREHKLFVKEDNPLVLVTSELEEFEKTYIRFLNRLKESSKRIDFSAIASHLGIKVVDPSKWSESEVVRFLQYEREKIEELRAKLQQNKVISKRKKLADYSTASLNSCQNELNSILKEISFLREGMLNHTFIPSTTAPILIFKMLIYAYSCRSTVIWPQIIKDKQTLKKLYSIV
jgi:hypothetical protein